MHICFIYVSQYARRASVAYAHQRGCADRVNRSYAQLGDPKHIPGYSISLIVAILVAASPLNAPLSAVTFAIC
jgi:hypothetical protein